MSGFCCLSVQFAAEHEGGDRKGEDVGGGLRHPRAVEAEYRRKDEQARDEEDNLPREAEEYGDARLAYGLEVVRYHNLRPDEHVHAHENAYGVGCQGRQFGVVVEAQGHLPGEEFAAQPAEGGYGRGRDDAVAQRLAHAVGAAEAVVVAYDGLHPLIEADYGGDYQRGERGDYAERPYRHSPAVDAQRVVHHYVHKADAYLQEEGRKPDGEYLQHRAPAQAHIFEAQVDGVAAVGEVYHHPRAAHCH